MLALPGYHVAEHVYEGSRFVYYRGFRQQDSDPILLKVPKTAPPSSAHITILKSEFEAKQLVVPGTLKPLELFNRRRQWALVLEGFGGQPAHPRGFMRQYGLDGFLKYALRTTQIIARLHQNRVIHRHLRPWNILFDDDLNIRIMGLRVGEFSTLADGNSQDILGVLAYLAPEQTGRLEIMVDVGADLYALGVIFYELLTGRRPFEAKEPMEMVHCHLARQPQPPHRRNRAVPMAVSRMVMKLLNKNPEDRYVSCHGLAFDLNTCLSRFEMRGKIGRLKLGLKDFRFRIPSRLYGRDIPLARIQDKLNRLASYRSEFVLITGPSGMGKSVFAREIRSLVTARGGFFIGGKYERGRMNIPYQGILQAIKDLVRQVAGEGEKSRAQWRERLLASLGANAQIMVKLIPQMEWILGKLPEVPRLGTAESQARFRDTLEKFIATFARGDHPLVLFLDDLQWADRPSMDFLGSLFGKETGHLLVLGAYRPQLAGPDPGLNRLLEKIDNAGLDHSVLELKPLDLIHIQALLRDLCHAPPRKTKTLAEIIHRKTSGNPFFIRVFLKALNDEGLLSFDDGSGHWTWDVARIRLHPVSSRDLTGLMTQKLSHLPTYTSEHLMVAACLGYRFNPQTLATLQDKSLARTVVELQPAVREGLIVPLDDSLPGNPSKWVAGLPTRHLNPYQFFHESVRSAVYAAMAAKDREALHLRVGSWMLARTKPRELDGKIFKIVNQMNRGRSRIQNDVERVQLAGLNLNAGAKAKLGIALEEASEYFLTGLKLLPKQAVDHYHELWFELNLHLAESEALLGDGEATPRFRQLIQASHNLAETTKVYETWVLVLNNTGRLDASVKIGREGLARHGLNVAEDQNLVLAEVDRRLGEIQALLGREGPKYFMSLPRAGDGAETGSGKQGPERLMMYMTPPAFNTNQPLFQLLTLLQVDYALRHGNSEFSAHGYAVLGILLGSRGDVVTGYELGRLALELNQRIPNPLIRYKLHFIGCNLLNHWQRSAREDLPTIRKIYRQALQYGDLVYANYTVLLLSLHQWILEVPLAEMLEACARHRTFAEMTKNTAVGVCLGYVSHMAMILKGDVEPSENTGGHQLELDCEKQLKAASYLTGISIMRVLKMETLYLQGHYARAHRGAMEVKEMLAYADNTLVVPFFVYLHALVLAAYYGQAEPAEQARVLDRLRGYGKRLRTWSQWCPANFRHMAQLVDAEINRLQGKGEQAMRHYREAVMSAKQGGFTLSEALAHELAAYFHLARDFPDYAAWHLRAAYQGFRKWGAMAKADSLKKMFPEMKAPAEEWEETAYPAPGYSHVLDMATLMQAARTLSREIRLENLLEKLMRLVCENAGAQRGLLLLQQGKELCVEAEYDAAEDRVRLTPGCLMSSRQDLACNVVNFVTRSRTHFVLAEQHRQAAQDDYLRNAGVKALLCMPLFREQRVLGVLYLENRLARGAFSEERQELLRMLVPQIAISLENARIIGNMANLNQALAEEVSERKKAEAELRKAQNIALANARNAGKAEFANSVLHNIKNVLTSVAVAHDTISGVVGSSHELGLAKAVALLRKHRHSLGPFLEKDPRGALLPAYLEELSEVLTQEREALERELKRQGKHLQLMKEIIDNQQSYAKDAARMETIDVVSLLEEVLRMQAQAIREHRIEVVRRYEMEEPIPGHKTHLVHILLNLVKNAIEAMGLQPQRMLTLRTYRDERGRPCLEITDTGYGMTPETLEGLFAHGFTTKHDGHGFGLHYCAEAMRAMDGQICGHSQGIGRGARFVLTFAPVSHPA